MESSKSSSKNRNSKIRLFFLLSTALSFFNAWIALVSNSDLYQGREPGYVQGLRKVVPINLFQIPAGIAGYQSYPPPGQFTRYFVVAFVALGFIFMRAMYSKQLRLDKQELQKSKKPRVEPTKLTPKNATRINSELSKKSSSPLSQQSEQPKSLPTWYSNMKVKKVVEVLRKSGERSELEAMLQSLEISQTAITSISVAALVCPNDVANFIEFAADVFSLSLDTDPPVYAESMRKAVGAGIRLLENIEERDLEAGPETIDKLRIALAHVMDAFSELQSQS